MFFPPSLVYYHVEIPGIVVSLNNNFSVDFFLSIYSLCIATFNNVYYKIFFYYILRQLGISPPSFFI